MRRTRTDWPPMAGASPRPARSAAISKTRSSERDGSTRSPIRSRASPRCARASATPSSSTPRTDLFLKAKPEDRMMRRWPTRRSSAATPMRKPAPTASSFPGLADLSLVERICRRSRLPVNAMHLPNGPSRAEWASAGIARVSHGPFPFMAMQAWLTRSRRGGARLGALQTLPPGLCPRARLQNGLAEHLRAEAQDQRHPQRCQTMRDKVRPQLRLLGGAGEHRHRRRQREDCGGERLRRNSGEPMAVAAKPKISTCAKVTGIDRVCTSRTVEACAPMVRNTAPNSR